MTSKLNYSGVLSVYAILIISIAGCLSANAKQNNPVEEPFGPDEARLIIENCAFPDIVTFTIGISKSDIELTEKLEALRELTEKLEALKKDHDYLIGQLIEWQQKRKQSPWERMSMPGGDPSLIVADCSGGKVSNLDNVVTSALEFAAYLALNADKHLERY